MLSIPDREMTWQTRAITSALAPSTKIWFGYCSLRQHVADPSPCSHSQRCDRNVRQNRDVALKSLALTYTTVNFSDDIHVSPTSILRLFAPTSQIHGIVGNGFDRALSHCRRLSRKLGGCLPLSFTPAYTISDSPPRPRMKHKAGHLFGPSTPSAEWMANELFRRRKVLVPAQLSSFLCLN